MNRGNDFSQKPQHQTMQGAVRPTRHQLGSVSKMSIAGSSRSPRRRNSEQQAPGQKPTHDRVVLTRNLSMYRLPVTNPIQHLPNIYAGKRQPDRTVVVKHVQGSRAGPVRKDADKTKLLSKRPSRDPIGLSPIRTTIPVEKRKGQVNIGIKENIHKPQDKLPDIRLPKKGKIMKPASEPDEEEIDMNQTKKFYQDVRPSKKLKLEVKGMTPKDKTEEKKPACLNMIDVLGKDSEPEFINSSGRALRDKVTRDILHYIRSAMYKRKLAERIMEEIDAKLEKALSQSQEQQNAMRFSTAKAEEQNISQLGFSLCITPLIGFDLIKSRDEIIECFNSMSTQIPTYTMTSTEIVGNVFENILASVIDVDTLNPDEDTDRLSPDSMINTLASYVFTVKRACEGILQRINTKDSQSPLHEPKITADSMTQTETVVTPADAPEVVTPPSEDVINYENGLEKAATDYVAGLCEGVIKSGIDLNPVTDLRYDEAAKEVLDLQQGLAISEENIPSEVDEQDLDMIEHHDHAIISMFKKLRNLLMRSSESEVKGKDEGEIESRDDFIPLPQTSATEQDLKPDDVAEEQLVAELGVDLDQVTPSEKNVPSEVDGQDLHLIGHQEHASPVPSPTSGGTPDSPRGSARRARPTTKASSWPDIPLSIPEESDTEPSTISQKKEDVLKHSLSLSHMQKARSLESAEKEEVKEMFLSESKKLSLLTSKVHDQDQSFGPEVKVKDVKEEEEEAIKAASESITHLDDPRTSRVETSDSGLDKSVPEEVSATSGDVSNLEDTPEKASTDLSSEVLVPSPPSSEKPNSPRGSARRARPTTKASSWPDIPLSIPEESDTETSTISQKKEDVLKHSLSLSHMEKARSLESTEKEEVKEMFLSESKKLSLLTSKVHDQDQYSGPEVKVTEEEEETIKAASESTAHLDDPQTSSVETSDSGLDKSHPEEVSATSGDVSNLEDTPEKASTDLSSEVLVPSPSSCEKPNSPRGSARRARPTTKASSWPNIPLSIPEESDTETSTISQKKEDVLKHSLSLSHMQKARSLESTEKEKVKEMFLSESKKLSLLTSKVHDQDQSFGPEVKVKDVKEEEEEAIKAASESITHLDDPRTSSVETSDSGLDKSVPEEVSATSGDVSNLEDTPEKASTDLSSEVLVPSPSSEKPNSPRGSARRARPTTKASSWPNIPLSIPEESDTETSTISQKKEDVLKHSLSLSHMQKARSLESAEKEEVKEMFLSESKKLSLLTSKVRDQDQYSGPEVKVTEEEEEEAIKAASESITHLDDPQTSSVETSDSGLDKSHPEEVSATSGDVSNLEDTPEKASTDLSSEVLVPSPSSSEKPNSPRGSARRARPTTKASSWPNIPLSIPEESDTETSTISQKKEDVLKHSLSLSHMQKARSLESAEKEDVKEMFLSESKKLSLLTSKVRDQDQYSGPEVKVTEEEEEEEAIKAASESITHLDDPRTSSVETSDSGLDKSVPEEVSATSGDVSNLEDTPEKASTDLSSEVLVPSPSSEKPNSPRGSARRARPTTKASSWPNIPLSIPEESDTETSTISQKKEDVLKHSLSLSHMEKARSLESAEKEDVKEMFLSESKKLSLLTSKVHDQDQSSGTDESILDDLTLAIEQDLKPEEGAEERLSDGSDVDVEQVLATPLETTTVQDLHQESASPVPAPPSTKKPVGVTRGSARRRTRPATKTKVLSNMEKAMKKGPDCSRTTSMYAESLTSSKTPDHEEATEKHTHKPARRGDASVKSLRTLRTVFSGLKTRDRPSKPEVPSTQSSVCDKEQDPSVSLDQKSSVQTKTSRSVTKGRAFPDCFTPCICDCEEEEL